MDSKTKYMKKRDMIIFIMSCLALCLIIGSCKKQNEKLNASIYTSENLKDESKDYTYFLEQKVDSILTTLTLEERVGESLMPSLPSSDNEGVLSRLKKWIEDYHIGGIVLLSGDINSASLIAQIGSEAQVPLFIAIDAEWGLGMRLHDAPVYQKNGNIGKEAGEVKLYDYGKEIAVESHKIGINMILGPVVDVVTDSKGVIGKRSFGSDPALVSDYGIAYAKGLESGGMISVAKHFPGHGSTYNDSHIGVAILNKNITALDTIDLKPFKEYINAGLSGVMAGHIQVKSLDPEGRAASVSEDILTSLLREELGFKGLIITDAFDMGGAKGFSASEAIKAGADLILCPYDVEKEYKELISNVKNGNLPIEIINDRCRRILFYKVLFGIIK